MPDRELHAAGDAAPPTIDELSALERSEDARGMEVQGLEQSLDQIAGALRDAELAGRAYDGLLGFSQGSYMVHRVAALASAGDARFAGKFRFALMVGKYAHQLERVFGAPAVGVVAVPSCHVFGDNEPSAFRDYTASYAPDRRVTIRHEQGHVFPVLDAQQTEQLRGFLRQYAAVTA